MVTNRGAMPAALGLLVGVCVGVALTRSVVQPSGGIREAPPPGRYMTIIVRHEPRMLLPASSGDRDWSMETLAADYAFRDLERFNVVKHRLRHVMLQATEAAMAGKEP